MTMIFIVVCVENQRITYSQNTTWIELRGALIEKSRGFNEGQDGLAMALNFKRQFDESPGSSRNLIITLGPRW